MRQRNYVNRMDDKTEIGISQHQRRTTALQGIDSYLRRLGCESPIHEITRRRYFELAIQSKGPVGPVEFRLFYYRPAAFDKNVPQ